MSHAFAEALAARVQAVLDGCTRCGRCFEACPTQKAAGLKVGEAAGVLEGVLAMLRGGEGPSESQRWAQICSGSGQCIPACPEGINPRFMLALARVRRQQRLEAGERHRHGVDGFARMGRGVRVLSQLQLSPEQLFRLRYRGPSDEVPELLFYTGCNVLRTPHIVLLAMDIFEAMGIRYEVIGGPGNCCGVIQFRAGDLESSGRIAYRTTDRFAQSGAATVVAWCPTCTIQLGEQVLPGRAEADKAGYALEAFVVYLASRLDRLQPLMTRPVNKRVGLHEHPGLAGVTESVIRILRAIPGLEYVELEQPQLGYMCNTLAPLPDVKRDLHQRLLDEAVEAGVDTLAGVYHACHRELCSHERDWPFEVVNFLELVGESMGLRREDRFKRLKLLQDADAIMADVMDLAQTHGLDLDEVRAVVTRDMLGEQPLPLRGG